MTRTDPFEPQAIQARCCHCGKTWETQLPRMMAGCHKSSVCNTCADLMREQTRRVQWWEKCPKRFQAFDPERFKGNGQMLSKAMEWRYSERGLVLHGHTGQGKTWAAIKIAEKVFMGGKSVEILNDFDLGRLAALASEGLSGFDSSMRVYVRVDLLVLNDPFKGSLSQRVQSILWQLVNERYETARPIILTMNGTPENIEPLLSADRAKPIFERFRSNCEIIHFPKPEEKQ